MKYIEEKGRITLEDETGNFRGEITYKKKKDNVIVVDHTYVPNEFRGQGIAGKLTERMVEYAKNHNLKIIPQCPYVKKAFENNEEYQKVEYHE